MPDLITHTIVASPFAVLIKRQLPLFFVIVGASFPDIVSRTLMVMLPNHYLLFWFAQALHTPIVIGFSAYLASMFFIESERRKIFIALVCGSLIHLGLDLLQKHYVGGYFLFFPFSYHSFEIPLFWSDEIVEFFIS